MAHTPGPWHFGRDLENKRSSIGNDFQTAIMGECRLEDARLISAAPEMLEILEEVSRLISRDARGGDKYDSYVYASGIQTSIDAVIAKARGTS